ncbi:MFS transporter [Spirillospora sp. NPDC029432]|uniref:MFS transporter n=1 Tax=Spirillospora sp. NPDC029432 TaxID=3154599 RepID=UPI003456C264
MGLRSGAGAAGRSTRTAARAAARAVRRATHAGGAGRSGLGTLIEGTALNSAGDAMVAVALAGTLFFGLDVAEARGQVALYLLLTMAPFGLVAPLVGPALDRMRHARRYALAGTLAARGLLCWGMAGAVLHGDEVTFLPAAFGVLVLSKAYGVLRAAVTPRVLPDGITLVTANARASFAGLIAAAVTAPAAAGFAALAGADWLLRLATVLFIAGAIPALRLPRHVDVPEGAAGREPLTGTETLTHAEGLTGGDGPAERREEAGERPARRRFRLWRPPGLGPAVTEAMLANAALRAFSGFLVLYLAFLLREDTFEPVSGNAALALLAAAAGAGGLAGTALGALAKARAPRAIVLGTLAFVTAAAAAAALFFGLWAALGVAAAAGLGQSLGKLSMDAVVQREIGEEARSSTFAVTETLHQLVWVLGGLLGLGLSIVAGGRAAMTAVAAALALALAATIRGAGRRRPRAARWRSSWPRPARDASPGGRSWRSRRAA